MLGVLKFLKSSEPINDMLIRSRLPMIA